MKEPAEGDQHPQRLQSIASILQRGQRCSIDVRDHRHQRLSENRVLRLVIEDQMLKRIAVHPDHAIRHARLRGDLGGQQPDRRPPGCAVHDPLNPPAGGDVAQRHLLRLVRPKPDLAGHDYIIERQLKPEARRDIIALLKELGVKPTSMIDISDGLASEALHLARASQLGILLYDEKLPIDPTTYRTARDFDLDPTTCALNGGEDYELLFTVAIADHEKIKGNPSLSIIGHMVDEASGCHLVDKQGGLHELRAQGWDAFMGK